MRFCCGVILLAVMCVSLPIHAKVHKSHAITLYDEPPKYAADFTHFDYVNPDAPKGGMFHVASSGATTFDNFHIFIPKGNPVSTGSIETLMARGRDESFTMYGLIAETLEWPDDRSWVIFNLNPKAKWHDGLPITADDVLWTFNTLIAKGRPLYRYYYGSVESVEKLSEQRVKFNFNEANNRELPMIIGQLPVLPKHYWASRNFEKTTLEPPLGSGPYQISKFEAGRYIVQSRVENYWAIDHPTQVGLNNFSTIRTEFFLDSTAKRLALKSGKIDFLAENSAKSWAVEYEVDAVDEGYLNKTSVPHQYPQGLSGMIMNTRQEIFSDIRVREAMNYTFDYEWTNKNLFFNQYTRSKSYFSNSVFAATGLPQDDELDILEGYRGRISARIFSEAISIPTTDGSGWSRSNLKTAFSLLSQAGWKVRDQKLLNEQGKQFSFEILLQSVSYKRIVLPWVRNLQRLGMNVIVRIVDGAQYVNRLRSFDYDVVLNGVLQSDSPGNEQRNYWSTSSAESPGSQNYSGIQDEVVDTLIEKLIQAPNRESLISHTRALDRILLFGYYLIPNYHLAAQRILYWDKFSRPELLLKEGVWVTRWWFDEAKADQLGKAIASRQLFQDDSSDQQSHPWLLVLLFVVLGIWMFRRYMRRSVRKREVK